MAIDCNRLLNSDYLFEIDITPYATETYVTLGNIIQDFDISLNEEVSQDYYLENGGYAVSDVTGAQLTISFSGHMDYTDTAAVFLYEMSQEIGCARKTNLKITDPAGNEKVGVVTLATWEGPSGAVESKGEISFELHYEGKPTYTPAP